MESICEAKEAAALFEAYHGRIYRFILHLVRNPAEAEDLTQDAFLRAYHCRDSLRDPRAVVGWLYRIATNVSLDRPRSRRPEVSIDGSKETPLASLAAAIPSALEIIEREETSRCVQHCLEFLPDPYRAVILLREGHSLTAPEIADLLGLRVTAVKMRLHRARRKLRQVMEIGCEVSEGNSGLPCCVPRE